jgi:adhesin HecA-like repeat protein
VRDKKEETVMFSMKGARIVLLLGIVLLAGVVHVAAAPLLSIEPPSQSVHAGQSFSLDVKITGVTDLFAFQFALAFTPGVLAATSITEGPFLARGGTTFFIPGTIDNAGGTIAATGDSLLGPLAGVTGSGTLATISFQALAGGTSPLTLTQVLLLDSQLGEIPVSLRAGAVTVQPATGVPEPRATLLLTLSLAGLLGGGWWRRQRTAS